MMKSKALRILAIMLTISGMNLSAQVSFYSHADVQSPNSTDIDNVYSSAYLTTLTWDQHWFIAGAVNDFSFYQGDYVPAIIIIDQNGNIQYSGFFNFDFDSAKQLIPLDVVEIPNYGFAICGKITSKNTAQGTAGFLMRLFIQDYNTYDILPQDITIYDNMISANSLVYTSAGAFLIAGQSYLDDIQGDPYDSLPCLILVDSADPSIYLDGYVVHDFQPLINLGSYEDIEVMGGSHFALTGKFRVLDHAYGNWQDYLNYDLLFSCFESSSGQINSKESIRLYTHTDMSDEIGKRLKSNGTAQLFITGESYDPVFQMYGKNIFAMKVDGNIAPGYLLNSLTYEFHEIELDNGTNDVFANGIDYNDAFNKVLTISGYYLDDLTYHPYIFQTEDFLTTNTFRNDFSATNPTFEYYLQRNHIPSSSQIVLGFGWEVEPGGVKRLLIVGDELQVQNQNCAASISPLSPTFETYPEQLYESTHTENPVQYNMACDDVIVTWQMGCNAPIFSSINPKEKSTPFDFDDKNIVEALVIGDMVYIKGASGNYMVWNNLGQVIDSGLIGNKGSIRLPGLNSGLFFIKLESNQKVYKIVK